jgi:hypothetical protein
MEKYHQEKNLLPNLPCIAKKLQELWQIFIILWNFQRKMGAGVGGGGGFQCKPCVFKRKKSRPSPNEQIDKNYMPL